MACHLVLTEAEYAVFTGDDEEAARRVFTKIEQQCREALFAYIRARVDTHADAEDTLEEVFAKAWENRKTLEDPRRVCSWLYRIARNECVNWLRRKKRRGTVFLDQPFDDSENGSSWADNLEDGQCLQPDEVAETNEQQEIARRAVERYVRPEQRAVLRLYYYEQMQAGEIADALELTVETVYSRLRLARSAITNYVLEILDPNVQLKLTHGVRESFPEKWHEWAVCRIVHVMTREEAAAKIGLEVTEFGEESEEYYLRKLRKSLGPVLGNLV